MKGFHFTFITTSLYLSSYFTSTHAMPCPSLCNGHGRCDTGSRQCSCYNGFFGADCSLAECPKGHAWSDVATAIDTAHAKVECSNRGLCDYNTATCVCDEGFEGQACERKTCPNKCNGHGRCQSMAYFASLKDPGSGTVYEYEEIWDSDMMYGCNCDPGYFGPDCSLKHCPAGDDPLTGTSLNPDTQQFNEKQQIVCAATGGTFTISFRGETTAKIAFDASSDEVKAALEALSTISNDYYDALDVVYVGVKTQACTFDGTTIQIEFLQDFGDLPQMTTDGSLLTHYYAGVDPTLTVTTIVVGTKENEYCSNRGLCNVETGVCTCLENYDTSDGYSASGQRGDCGYADITITNCPGEVACSGHGVCQGDPTYRCSCSKGWTGGDCSEMTCPYGRSWFSLPTDNNEGHLTRTECSDMGICDREYGICNCLDGFEGAACERLKCPTGGLDDVQCSGHGKCMTMALLAEWAEDNGDLTPYTYGTIPNDPLVWDFDKVQGCLCDDDYWGYDCSLRYCPTGDDPATLHQLDEIQDLYCQDNGDGKFKLTFRQQTTDLIYASSSMDYLKNALESLSTVNKVDLEDLNGNDKVCDTTGNTVRIKFLTSHSDLPDLQITESYIDSISITEFVKGTKEQIECSGRGLCDYSTGLCECFTGYGSSDGMGGPGAYGDCGFQELVIAPQYITDV